MIRSLLTVMLLCATTSPTAAQDVRVRSGEHGNFTRLALDIPADTGWSIDQSSSDAIDVRLGGENIEFDLSRALTRLNEERVLGVSELPGDQGIRISLGCACVAEAFLANDRMLVVDIRRGISSPQASTVDQSPARVADEAATSETPSLSSVRIGQNPGIGPKNAGNALLPDFNELVQGPRPFESESQSAATGLDPGVFEHMLAEQLATAATDGLLDSAMRSLPKAGDSHVEQKVNVSPLSSSQETPEKKAARAIEAVISGREPGNMQSHIRIGGATCVAERDLDITSWGGDDPLADTIPALRGRLFGEFDRLDRDVVIGLARAYTSIGFGAEARAVLDLDSDTQDSALFAIAGIVDGYSDRAGVFAGQTNCDGPAAFWALIGSVDLPGNAGVNQKAILTTFEGLSLRMRTQLGPRLATRLAEEGFPDAARNVLSRLERATGEINDDMMFSKAQIDRLNASHDQAHEILNAIASKSGPNAPEAMAQAIELATENRERVNSTLADLSGAYSTEMRDTEKGPDLWLAHLRALTANGQYDASFGQLFDKPNYPRSIRAKATTDLLTLLTEQAQDTAFLKHSLARTDGYDGLASSKSALLVAGRLLDLGLPEPAKRWLDFEGIDRTKPDVRLLSARAHLAQAEPEQAEIALIGLKGNDALSLRAEARRMMGDYSYAAEAYTTLGNTENARRSAWLAGEPNLGGGERDALSAAMRLRQDTIPDPASNAPSLAVAETVAGAGADTRGTIRALLDATRLSAE
ncbi:hypothetical protein ATI53_10046 [Salipiger aestuarii]|uniref:Tetratricopeptide repeat protein n=1 Tax=Salipiger aestuarii TaxID=568098 RepID=A0A327YK75_9RHOB|nr:hypothetical protein [Salipiger aestuarii]RAK21408.1 hypothetical protein ATI53_10046 [Salipiger aestuarii]